MESVGATSTVEISRRELIRQRVIVGWVIANQLVKSSVTPSTMKLQSSERFSLALTSGT